MRDRLEKRALLTLPSWKTKSERISRLTILDMHLDGTIYKCLPHEYDEETTGTGPSGRYIRRQERKPSTRLGLAGTSAQTIARKLFAGRHAPTLVLEKNPKLVKDIQAYLDEAHVNNEMIGLARFGSVGSACATFKTVEADDGELKLVMNVFRARDCFPTFDGAKKLKKLRVAYLVTGQFFLDNELTVDIDNEALKPFTNYWFVMDLDSKSESYSVPMPERIWNPIEGFVQQDEQDKHVFTTITDGPLAKVEHGLNLKFVPAQWFTNLSGGTFPDGGCLFEPALNNIVQYDYQMSQLDLGLASAACPMTVIEGPLMQELDSEGRPIPRSPNRYLRFAGGTKDADGGGENAGKAYYLESNGQGFLADLALCKEMKKDAIAQISASQKDPDKVTTAMSGKGMEIVDEEYIDLAFELRTSYGGGWLEMVQKMVLLGIEAGHPKLKNVTTEDAKELKDAWPDMHDMAPQEYAQFVAGVATAQENGMIDNLQAQDMHRAKVDVPANQATKKNPVKLDKPKSGEKKK
ncbi:MAG TPA: hypothetical protein V6C76_11695 [Drouetiella sp.]